MRVNGEHWLWAGKRLWARDRKRHGHGRDAPADHRGRAGADASGFVGVDCERGELAPAAEHDEHAEQLERGGGRVRTGARRACARGV